MTFYEPSAAIFRSLLLLFCLLHDLFCDRSANLELVVAIVIFPNSLRPVLIEVNENIIWKPKINIPQFDQFRNVAQQQLGVGGGGAELHILGATAWIYVLYLWNQNKKSFHSLY